MKIFHNAVVYTGDNFTSAFAVEDGRFVAVGADALALEGERIDLNGAFACAGFNDSHMHLLSYGQALSMAPLAAHTGSLEEVLACLKNARPDRGWILGRGWNQDYFSDVPRMPSRRDLDRVSTRLPVCATRACGHALVVNSKALELLGITAATPSPEGGEIDFENGRFFDNAMDLVLNAIPVPDKETIQHYIRTACRELNRRGITSCHSDDYCVFRALPWQVVNEAYRELEANRELTLRVREQANLTTLPELGATVSNGSDCPVEAPDVLAGIQCAVTRQDLHGCAPYLPREAFTVKEAIDSFTKSGAWASFEEHTKGSIAPGHHADFVILGTDPFHTAPSRIREIPVRETWLGGERVL